MMFRRVVLMAGALTALAAVADASAASLAADSLLCESAETLQFVSSRAEFTSEPASAVIKQAKAGLEAYKMHRPGLDTVGTVPRTRTTPMGEDGVIGVASYCVASGDKSAVKVVERKATQGLAKVQTVYQGRRIERWVFASALSE